MTRFNGIDVSVHNGVIDWSKVKADGVEFAMIRAGYGKRTIDDYFKRNMAECARAGIPVGVYWFSYALSEAEAIEEAERCLEAIRPYRIEYPIAFDFEYDSVRYAKEKGVIVDKALASKMAEAFCETIKNAGYYAAVYTNKDFSGEYFSEEILQKYDIWLAAWSKSADLDNPPECSMWQYTDSGRVDGINGDVDKDVSYVDYPKLIGSRGGRSKTELPTGQDQTTRRQELRCGLCCTAQKANKPF